MKKIEDMLSGQLGDEEKLEYPDFDAMWTRIQSPSAEEIAPVADVLRPRSSMRQRRRKWVVVSAIAAVLIATPVFAAVTGHWDFSIRSGIESALKQGLGQTIERSAEADRVTFTLHTAIADDNRTVLLYSFDPGTDRDKRWSVEKMSLRDKDGKVIEGHYYHSWDENAKRFNGIFETEWTFSGSETEITWSAKDLSTMAAASKPLALDPFSSGKQVFPIGKNGMDALTVLAIPQGEDTIILRSAIGFTDPRMKKIAAPRIQVFAGDKRISPSSSGTFGAPGEKEEWTAEQFYKRSDLQGDNMRYELSYTYEDKRIPAEWKLDNVTLNKSQMKAGSFTRDLNVPVQAADGRLSVKQLIVTPTQVRMMVESENPHASEAFMKTSLQIGDHMLEGHRWYEEAEAWNRMTYRFERPAGIMITPEDAVTLIWKYEVEYHKKSDKPISLPAVSETKKSIIADIGGYPVKLTYYMEDGDLYVESESDNAEFGGINQTYMKADGEAKVAFSLMTTFVGDGKNKSVDVYRDFTGTDAEIFISSYTTDHPEREVRVPLK